MTQPEINLSELPAPNLIEGLDYEGILEELIQDYQARNPEFDAVLESEPVIKLLEVAAYRELLLKQQINEQAKGLMLAYAENSNLDQLGALVDVKRHVIQEADEMTIPPTEEILESDDDYRRRIQLAPKGFSVAGPSSAYIYHALSADPEIKDVSVSSPSPGVVAVTILGRSGDGSVSQELIDLVQDRLESDDVRPLTDQVIVQGAEIVEYSIDANLTIKAGPDKEVVLEQAKWSAQQFADRHHRLGQSIALSGIYAALHVSGVEGVELVEPAQNTEARDDEVLACISIHVL